ncbi:MAG TPA: AraC family transcriptional regulator [Steroidobacteraceae bacterium]|nr:AraC family transcriptional regulator [Steroidobacteraceae bacterium]
MSFWRFTPDPRLRGVVACYWVMDGAPSAVPTEELMLPDGHSEVVFSRARGNFERWKLGDRMHAPRMTGSYLIGGRSHTVGTRSAGALKLAGVKLDSRLLRAWIRTPLSDFRDNTLTFAELGDASLLDLEDAVASAPSPAHVAALFDDTLLAVLAHVDPTPTATDALMRQIHHDRGATPILRWAAERRIDARALERRFCASTGLTPKQFARVIRFKHAYRALGARATTFDGFYDQSHFNREFRHFTGVAPGVKLAGRMAQGTLVADHLLEAG